jgi:hypothetical protein
MFIEIQFGYSIVFFLTITEYILKHLGKEKNIVLTIKHLNEKHHIKEYNESNSCSFYDTCRNRSFNF